VGGTIIGSYSEWYSLIYDGSTLLISDFEDYNTDSIDFGGGSFGKQGSVSVYNLPYTSGPPSSFDPTALLAFFP
jgi:hypothetical protein